MDRIREPLLRALVIGVCVGVAKEFTRNQVPAYY